VSLSPTAPRSQTGIATRLARFVQKQKKKKKKKKKKKRNQAPFLRGFSENLAPRVAPEKWFKLPGLVFLRFVLSPVSPSHLRHG
jgi:hypothetical protein